jgi:hypothetical protein
MGQISDTCRYSMTCLWCPKSLKDRENKNIFFGCNWRHLFGPENCVAEIRQVSKVKPCRTLRLGALFSWPTGKFSCYVTINYFFIIVKQATLMRRSMVLSPFLSVFPLEIMGQISDTWRNSMEYILGPKSLKVRENKNIFFTYDWRHLFRPEICVTEIRQVSKIKPCRTLRLGPLFSWPTRKFSCFVTINYLGIIIKKANLMRRLMVLSLLLSVFPFKIMGQMSDVCRNSVT